MNSSGNPSNRLSTVILAFLALASLAPVSAKQATFPKEVTNLIQTARAAQRSVVTAGGDEANPGYSDVDRVAFTASHGLDKVAHKFKTNPDFARGVTALRKLPAADQRRAIAAIRAPIDRAWAENGQVGIGTTDAGEAVEVEIGKALARMVAAALRK